MQLEQQREQDEGFTRAPHSSSGGEGRGKRGGSKDSVQPDEHSAAAAAIHNSATPYPQYFTFKQAAGRPRMEAQDDQQRLYPSLLGVW